jgi:DNA-binding response OmpR family regulator
MPPRPLIYVLEDNQVMCSLICLHLHQAGYDVRGFEDAIEGGKAMLERRPDVLVLDIAMPYLNGLELLNAMRTDEKTAGIPTIVLTARTDSRAEEESWAAGARHFIVKPLQRQELLDAVADILSEPQGTTSA